MSNKYVKYILRICLLIANAMKQHLGQILEKSIRQSGYPISKLAKKVGYTRQHMYNLFAQEQVDLILMDEIGKVIHVDFSEQVKTLKKYVLKQNSKDLTLNESEIDYATNTKEFTLQNKYLLLLEDYNSLLKEHNSMIKLKFLDYLKKYNH